ncbi:TadE/TadG family type IV pilus assembly protein [Lichenibacterium ramalinae]|uniref:Pilus assembly protein n=1 Tax=Lichenibacterium ramalinae TaxID=2316527 RepID=A0A4Q2R8X3_9HYPH|nr:TadE/TadG family type IV pilus assembly protein [Lichenibacterium ramalinae]RYB01910.1 pilus assembly protein [Lichenibacterium ramalinae]
MRRPGPLPRRFLAAEAGTSAIEFALVLPVLALLLLAGLQVVLYVNATRRVELVANSISQMISQAAPATPSSTTATVNALDLHFSYDSALVLFPYLMRDASRQGVAWWQDITIDYASIQFTQTSQSCSGATDQSACYVANVVWTSTGTAGNRNRPCVVAQAAADDTAAPSPKTLPRSVFGSGSIIAVDVSFTFVPTFGSQFLQPIQITRSVFVQPRYASLIKFDTSGNDGIASTCPGF